MFFDTNFHLTNQGAKEYTYRLAKALKAEYGDYSYTGRPEADEGIKSNAGETYGDENIGEKSDAGSDEKLAGISGVFKYKGDSSGLRITGITHEAGSVSELKIPEEIDGVSVISIDDGIFDGLAHLRRIVVPFASPEDIRVGRNLLDGCDAIIIVKRDSLSKYRMNYFWSTYADRLEASD